MRRLTAFLAICIMLCPLLAWGVGTCTESISRHGQPANDVVVVTFTCTADAAAATYPATSLSSTALQHVGGRYLALATTNPGTTGPTAAYDIVLNDADGIDVMGGTLANRSATASEQAVPLLMTGVYGGRLVAGSLQLAVTGNSVNSAVTVINFHFVR